MLIGPNGERGVTLVELMIVVLILGLLAVAASPFTSGWVKEARMSEGAATLEQAIARAKAAALRNTARVTGDNPASLLCLSASKTTVSVIVPASNATVLSCNQTPVWTGTIDAGVTARTIRNAVATNWACSCFTNKGLPTQAAGTACTACSNSLEFRFSHNEHTGADGEQRNFY